MQMGKQKLQSCNRISRPSSPVTLTVEQYRALIVLPEFSLRQIQIYNTFAPLELAALQTSTIQLQKLRELAVDTLKLTFIYDPVRQTLLLQHRKLPNHISLKTVLRILSLGEFYRFINNHDNQIKILINNKTTELNVKILIASLFVLASRKLTLEEISTALLFFSLEAALNNNDSGTLPPQGPRVLKVLKKIERVIKPAEFKAWMQSVRTAKEFNGSIQPHQFLYLCSLSERKFSNGLGYILVQPKISSLFKNLNLSTKAPDLELKLHHHHDAPPDRRIVRGLTFVSPRAKQRSFSKEILKEFRLNDPTKHKRPDTAYLRRHVRSFANLNQLRSLDNQKQSMKGASAGCSLQVSQTCSLQASQTCSLQASQISRLGKHRQESSCKLAKKNMRKKAQLKLNK